VRLLAARRQYMRVVFLINFSIVIKNVKLTLFENKSQ
jgi:hypothetical protein